MDLPSIKAAWLAKGVLVAGDLLADGADDDAQRLEGVLGNLIDLYARVHGDDFKKPLARFLLEIAPDSARPEQIRTLLDMMGEGVH